MIEVIKTKIQRPEKTGDTYPPAQCDSEIQSPWNIASEVPISLPHTLIQSNDFTILDTCREQIIDVNRVAESLENAAEEIMRATNDLFAEPISERISKWIDLHGLNRSAASGELLSKQAAFQLLLKTALYEHHYRRGDLPALTGDISKALQFARRRTNDSRFDETVLDDIVRRAHEDVATDIAAHRHRLLASTQPTETIARIYEKLIESDYRRSLGQYRTLPEVSDLMRSWAARGAETVLDPGLGAGALSTPYHPDWHLSTDPDHAIGIDRSPLSRLMGTTALSITGQQHDARTTDFLDLAPEELDGVDAVIANPPYTDSQTLSTEDKLSYRAAAQRATGRDIDAKTPLHGYFIYHSRQFLADGDRMATITPQAWLGTEYGRTLKRFLLDEFRVRALVLFNPETVSVFDGPMTTGLIAFLEAASDPNPNETVHFVRIDDLSELETADGDRDWQPVRDLIHGDAPDDSDWGFVNAVRQADLSPERNWQARFDPVDVDTRGLPSLGDLLTVTRGPTAGDVGFFCLSEEDVADAGLDERYLSKIVRRPTHIRGYDYRETDWQTARAEGKEVWLLDPDRIRGVPDSIEQFAHRVTNDDTNLASADTEADADLIEYLRTAVTEHGLNDVRALKNRQYWYRPRRREPARVLVQSSGRNGFKFMLNETAIKNTSACYGFYDIDLSDRELKALLAYLNSDTFAEVARRHQRTLDDGFQKIEPRNLERAPVIDPTGLSDDTLAALVDAFDELCRTARQGRDWSDALARIDRVLNRVV